MSRHQDLLAVVYSATEDEPVFEALEALRHEGDAVSTLLVQLQPNPIYAADGAVAATVWEEMLERNRKEFAQEKKLVDQRCTAIGPTLSSEILEAITVLAGQAITNRARHADMVVMLRPDGASQQDARRGIFEDVLFGAGRPVLLIPPKWRRGAIGRNIVVGWSAKREAARAVADAAPFIEAADKVTAIAVNADAAHDREGSAEIVAHLERKGAKVFRRGISTKGDEGEALLEEALALNADLIVIGGYGKARLREWVFGGVTRTLTYNSSIPILLSH